MDKIEYTYAEYDTQGKANIILMLSWPMLFIFWPLFILMQIVGTKAWDNAPVDGKYVTGSCTIKDYNEPFIW